MRNVFLAAALFIGIATVGGCTIEHHDADDGHRGGPDKVEVNVEK